MIRNFPKISGRNCATSLQGQCYVALPGGDNIGANFYPALDPYSSYDTTTLATHMDMLEDSGIQAIFLTWWGQTDFTAGNIPLILQAAQQKGIKVGFQIEPYASRSAGTVRADIVHILQTYGSHPAFYRTTNGWPLFFIYDSYLIPATDWANLLTDAGSQTIRNTANDALVIGLWVSNSDQANQIDTFTYLDYGPLAQDHYLTRTKHWSDLFLAP